MTICLGQHRENHSIFWNKRPTDLNGHLSIRDCTLIVICISTIPHGPPRSPEKQSNQKINLRKAMIKPLHWLSEKKQTITSISYLKIDHSLYNVWKTWNPFIQGCFATYLVEIDTVFLEKKTLTFCQCTFAISFLFPLEKGVALHLNNALS